MSPACRLGMLYLISFCVIVVLTAVCQGFILKELAWQSRATASLGGMASKLMLDHPLSSKAMELMLADGQSLEDAKKSLRRTIQQVRQATPETRSGGDKQPSVSLRGIRPAGLIGEAEVHRASACQAAEALLALFETEGASRSSKAEATALARRITEEEEASARNILETAQGTANAANKRIGELDTLELFLFDLVLLALMVEGVFVISPAVVKIQGYMQDLEQSHEVLKAHAAKLERSNRELQDFASVASHDLQEPLRKVQAFSDRLRSKYAAALDDQGRDYLDRMQNAAGRMQTLINDLLTYARVSTKAKPFVPTDLVSVTREVVSDLEARIEQVNGKVEVGELPTLDADPLQVRQLMQNLIGNSLKYRRPEVPPVVRVSSQAVREDPAGSSRPSRALLPDPRRG